MAMVDLEPLTEIGGFIAGCLADGTNGMVVRSRGESKADLEVVSAGSTPILRAQRKMLASLGVEHPIEDILISLPHQLHLIQPLLSNNNFFLYLILDRTTANLGLARYELKRFADGLDFG